MSEQSDPNQGPPSYVYHGTNGILPPFIKELLNNWPPNRTHWHILSIANRLRHYIPAEEAVELIRAHMPRGEKKGEIEETIKRAYDVLRSGKPIRPQICNLTLPKLAKSWANASVPKVR